MRDVVASVVLLASMWMMVGIIALEPTQRILVERCHPPMDMAQETLSITVWPITLGSAITAEHRC